MTLLRRISRRLKGVDTSSEYAFWVGITSIMLAGIVAVRTFWKLLLSHTSIGINLIITFIVFYIFLEIYSLIIFYAVSYFRKKEDKL